MTKSKGLATLSAAVVATTATHAALACPYCAASAGRGSVGVTIALGALLTLPFLVVFTIVRFLRSERGRA